MSMINDAGVEKNYLEYIKRKYKIYRKKGVKKLVVRMWVYLLRDCRLSIYIKHVLGKRLHQKLLNGPRVGYYPKIKKPRSFNEKIMHRKIYTNKDEYRRIADKYEVRNYVQKKIGKCVLSDLIYTTLNPHDIILKDMPEKFVIKANHGSGWNIIVDDKDDVEIESIIHKCKTWMQQEYSKIENEYWYWDIKRRILVEEFIEDEKYKVPIDYKLFVFHGEVKYIQVDLHRFENHKRIIYDRNWNKQSFGIKYKKGEGIEKPVGLDKMIQTAEKLGEDFSSVRVDLYNPTGTSRVIFGEMTLAHGSGSERFIPLKWDFKFGSYWRIDTTI